MVCETSYKRKFVKSISVIPVKNGARGVGNKDELRYY